MRESRSYGTVGGVVRLRAGRPYPGKNKPGSGGRRAKKEGGDQPTYTRLDLKRRSATSPSIATPIKPMVLPESGTLASE